MILFLFSGKRKSGKDYIADLFKKQNPEIQTYQISAPLKIEYALQNGLNYQELLTSSNYKEQYETFWFWSHEDPMNKPMNGPMHEPMHAPMNIPMNGPINNPMNSPMNIPWMVPLLIP